MSAQRESSAEETVDERLSRRETEAEDRITEADTANRSAISSLSSFMREIRSARRLLSGTSTPADALLEARDAMREEP